MVDDTKPNDIQPGFLGRLKCFITGERWKNAVKRSTAVRGVVASQIATLTTAYSSGGWLHTKPLLVVAFGSVAATIMTKCLDDDLQDQPPGTPPQYPMPPQYPQQYPQPYPPAPWWGNKPASPGP